MPLIKKPSNIPPNISEKRISLYTNINYPLFSFKYLSDASIKKCKDSKFFYNLIMRLQKLSDLGWEGIRTSQKHSFGLEKIPQKVIKPNSILPKFITPEMELDVFRANGDNRALVGFQKDKIFCILFIEAKFGDIYNHK